MSAFVRVAGLAALLVVGMTRSATGQVVAPPSLDQIWAAYHELDFETARARARAALETPGGYTRTELADVHIVLGLVEMSENRQAEARRQFATALGIYPDAQLDALLVSPKILAVFEEVRADLDPVRREEAGTPGPVRYVFLEDQRAAAALRSMVVPGWGQYHKGEHLKGRVLVGIWGLTLGGSLATHVLRRQAQSDYEAARTPEEALDRYDTFNRWHRTRNALLMGAAGVWLYSYVDALLVDTRPGEQRLLSLAPSYRDRRWRLTARVRF